MMCIHCNDEEGAPPRLVLDSTFVDAPGSPIPPDSNWDFSDFPGVPLV